MLGLAWITDADGEVMRLKLGTDADVMEGDWS